MSDMNDSRRVSGVVFGVYMLLLYCISFFTILKASSTIGKGLPDTFVTRAR
jgi:hypothetical protein